jgi:hypothetical protein
VPAIPIHNVALRRWTTMNDACTNPIHMKDRWLERARSQQPCMNARSHRRRRAMHPQHSRFARRIPRGQRKPSARIGVAAYSKFRESRIHYPRGFELIQLPPWVRAWRMMATTVSGESDLSLRNVCGTIGPKHSLSWASVSSRGYSRLGEYERIASLNV